MVNKTVYQFVGSKLEAEMFLKKKEHGVEKGVLKQKIEVFLYTFYWGFKKIPFTFYIYVSAKILQTGVKFIQKLTPGFKNHNDLNNFRKAVEIPKSLNLMGYFCPKNTVVQKMHSFS